MLKTIIALLSSCVFFSGAVFAEEAAQVKEDAPDRYVVVKGDTLWAISGKFLKDPWRWPEIWKLNKEEIKNPHLIYPGDVVVLDRANGELRLVKNAKYQGRDFEKRSPQTRVEPTDRAAIPVISPADIGPFLSQPLVIEKDGLESAPRILANEENRVVIGSGNRAYVEGLKEGGPKQWHIFRPGKALIDPDTQVILGYEAIYLGDARVLKYGEAATIEIIKSVQEILRDDRLVAATNVELANIVPHAPSKDLRGRIISSYGGVAETGRGSIVSLNRGTKDGLETGHVLALYRFGQEITLPKDDKPSPSFNFDRSKCLREGAKVSFNEAYDSDKAYGPCPDGAMAKSFGAPYTISTDEEARKLKLPEERYGLVLVFRTFEKVSYALVMQSSLSVRVNDVVEKP
ncbi:MAG: LysM peptidoglycan-binding domain-containing protein [Burkholderiales bacterium]|nr:LysM peptidoglycan-binding domain-containing protein [Burkholderiales bacterium]